MNKLPKKIKEREKFAEIKQVGLLVPYRLFSAQKNKKIIDKGTYPDAGVSIYLKS